ncbi:hypothetical protein NST39_03270 [Bacillus sp. FSL W8-0645]|uniref:hypothetical protein n=1 Tax=Bacillus TaxID=1386 RepID=UPI001C2376B4|nr:MULTISPECIES: hypothetical protein [Bacillus]MBU8576644.1 hypothetical protein [Bacillus pumilus]MCY7464321.1 hypothetical protein [Bacillus safensis]MCY7566755.1 hypothetical protein [Bacillus safensis]MED1528795.1 hypothetical protein [Bacillus pumilus]
MTGQHTTEIGYGAVAAVLIGVALVVLKGFFPEFFEDALGMAKDMFLGFFKK